MTNDELLKAYMDQLARDQQNYRDDMRAMQERFDERIEKLEAQSNERIENVKRDIRANIWSALGVAATVAGISVALLR